MPTKQSEIEKHVQLLVEGRDTKGFFEALRRHLHLEDLQLHDFGGVSELRTFLPAFVKLPKFSSVTSIGIVRDADDSATRAFESVQGCLKRSGLAVPSEPGMGAGDHPRVKVLVLPGKGRPGMLETLLCDTIRDEEVHTCIDTFFECIKELQGEPAPNLHKARARAFLATKPYPQFSVGVAANKGYWNLDHAVLDPVRAFLREIAAPHRGTSRGPHLHA